MTTGTVTFYDPVKGFGFVRADETNEDFFFHHKMLLYEPCVQNDHVQFEVIKSKLKPGKLCAIEVQKID